ncbi:MAG: hypothetical protein U0K57_06675 [Lachnospiraceae bacterium]|nr:hypothetical protein [Lachnospiraceae bacterium]
MNKGVILGLAVAVLGLIAMTVGGTNGPAKYLFYAGLVITIGAFVIGHNKR